VVGLDSHGWRLWRSTAYSFNCTPEIVQLLPLPFAWAKN
jgi:hypothetical protein